MNIPDSFVKRENKSASFSGNGEAKFYVGAKSDDELRSFFGPTGFRAKCYFNRQQLIEFMSEIRPDYESKAGLYRAGGRLKTLWKQRFDELQRLTSEELEFTVTEQRNVGGSRCYVKGVGHYELLRSLPLANLASAYFTKFEAANGTRFLVEIHRDNGESARRRRESPIEREEIESSIVNEISENRRLTAGERQQLIAARIGQGEFRARLLKSCGGMCPITGISNERLLVASHIKPWRSANNDERIDAQNGLLLSPVYDKLFDIGLITFTDEGAVLLSSELDSDTSVRVRLKHGQIFDNLPVFGRANARRRGFLTFHRESVFLG